MSPPTSQDRTPPPEVEVPATSASVREDAAAELIDAGLAAERAGHRVEARACLERALHRLQGTDAGPRAASVLRWIARTYMTDADSDAAMDCAVAALAVAQACHDEAGEGHAVNVQAAIYWAQGNLDAAEPLFLAARASALAANDRALAAMTSHNLGVIANIRGDLAEALHHYSVGLEHYRALGRSSDVCVALNNMGRLHTELRRWAEAERAFAEAVEISDSVGDRTARIGLEVNRAEMWLARGNVDRAADAVGEAVLLTDATGDSAWRAQIAKLQGVLRRDAGALVEAEAHFTEAAALAEARQDMLLLAETLRERAELLRGQGRNREALQHLNRAHRLFTQMRAKRELANTDRSVSRLEDDFVDVVKRWGESIEAKDIYTQGHCVRVADLACAIAAACGIDGQSLFWFRIGALLHDVGKLVVPSEVLNKPGRLTPEEWELMRTHPAAGVDMLAGIDFPWDVRPIIESHHERWDGRGYPHGLAGESIPLSARILAVADVYDALTSVRSYKPALSHEAAVEVMRQDSGLAFDPEIFSRFEEVVKDGAAATSPAGATQVAVEAASRSEGTEPAEPAAAGLSIADGAAALPGRRTLERLLAQALADRRQTGGCVALLAVEMDLSSAPETGGAERPALLRRMARRLRSEMRTTDFVARMEENQFMVLLAGPSAEHARSLMLRVQGTLSGVAQRHRVTGHNGSVEVRTAVVSAPLDGDSVPELVAAARAAIAAARCSPPRRLGRANS